ELADALDKIFPYKFPDFKLGDHIQYARHALAIDDERHTFSPLLWDESHLATAAGKTENGESKTEPKKLLQVWFTGMHADVGGGYPEDMLAHVPLAWMIDQINDIAGGRVRFKNTVVREITESGSATGKLHDSRKGFACFYRYKPRHIARLCGHSADAKKNEIKQQTTLPNHPFIKIPIIHHTVLDRIGAQKVGYNPAGLPKNFDVYSPSGEVVPYSSSCVHYQAGETFSSENAAQYAQRTEMHERARGHIFWSRGWYFIMLFSVLALVFAPVLAWLFSLEADSQTDLSFLAKLSYWAIGLFERVATLVLPADAVAILTESWRKLGSGFFWISLVFGATYVMAGWTRGNAVEESEIGWAHVKGSHLSMPEGKRYFSNMGNKIRKHKGWIDFHQALNTKVVPVAFAGCIVVLALVGIYYLYGFVFQYS
ncbi:MAG: DUF2235 domain-containing protein, partial [Pseudomonadota bacterium]